MRKKILLLSTGGTIASEAGENGLVPAVGSSGILGYVADAYADCDFFAENLLNLDSSNIQPEHWQIIAQRVCDCFCQPDPFDGIIVTHGTDTMAYTASALAFMLRGLDALEKSVVLTGSQVPIGEPQTDAVSNLHTAIAAVRGEIVGVTVAFDRKIINGTRASKIGTMRFDAFESVNVPPMARLAADGIEIFSRRTTAGLSDGVVRLEKNICPDVFLLKLLPGTKPELLGALPSLGYRGLVVEAFGAGGVHYEIRNLPETIRSLTDAGMPVVMCSQCLYGRVDPSIYEVGRHMLDAGVISARDMTTEAASTKLMWALGQTSDAAEIAKIFATNFAGEITL